MYVRPRIEFVDESWFLAGGLPFIACSWINKRAWIWGLDNKKGAYFFDTKFGMRIW